MHISNVKMNLTMKFAQLPSGIYDYTNDRIRKWNEKANISTNRNLLIS